MSASTWSMSDSQICNRPQLLPSRVYSDQENNFVDPWYKDLPRDVSIRASADEKTDVFTMTFPPVPGTSFS
jgi:hypothetical protein